MVNQYPAIVQYDCGHSVLLPHTIHVIEPLTPGEKKAIQYWKDQSNPIGRGSKATCPTCSKLTYQNYHPQTRTVDSTRPPNHHLPNLTKPPKKR